MKTLLYGMLFPVLVLALFPSSLSATQRDEKAESLLKKAEVRLSQTRTLTAEIYGTVSDQRPNRLPLLVYNVKVRLMRPNLAWIDCEEIEGEKKAGNTITPKISRSLLVSTGKTIWKFDPQKNEYHRTSADLEGKKIPGLADALTVSMPLYMFFNSRVPHIETSPLYAGTETRDGVTYQILEFKTEGDPPVSHQRLYFAADNLLHHIINKQLSGQYVVDWKLKNIRINAPLSATDFAYAPPATAKNVSQPTPKLLAVGTDAPDFTVADANGKPVKLSDYKGKVVVLDFWSTGCGPCLESREHMNTVARKFRKEVVFLSVHVWDTKEAFAAWLPKHRQFDALNFAIDTAPAGKDIATTLYQTPGLPTHYVIGKDGKIVRGFLGYSGPTPELENVLKATLGKAR